MQYNFPAAFSVQRETCLQRLASTSGRERAKVKEESKRFIFIVSSFYISSFAETEKT
jgi:hypothetical protein